ncbi:L-seryl-tRNA(Sec) kinase-like isoform X2 [Salvelinus fontinalis]|uniref:L-seryl-tRNA(Sec) kinase-like isoform X2 n=1 Tax=Salvelinus fontinalis TaxID=8038 RepID=UPI00248675F8|nr:L-seryl-tRNA(Sec) kinase-like isoform X2 [Salvelinus fontinalis]
MDLNEDSVNLRCAPGICLCVLCGLPAAGKSTLAQAVNSHTVQRGWRSTVISYDDLIPGDAFDVKEVEDEEDMPRSQTQTKWKLHRQAVLQCVERFLQSPTELGQLPPSIDPINSDAWSRLLHAAQVCGTSVGSSRVYPSPLDRPAPPLVILLDDNFYYPSMRYEVYQLARKHSVGFCQVYVHCPVESCVRRNQLRPRPLPSDVIVEMARRMEPPDPQRNTWEQNSVTLDSEHHFTVEYIQRLVKVISTALENPLSPVQDNAEQKEADRQSCVSSVVHQADQACRRLVSQAMQGAREHQLPPERMRSLAAHFNQSKTRFLQDLRKQVLHSLPLTRVESVDVERLVNRAVDVFNKEKQEILERYLPLRDTENEG